MSDLIVNGPGVQVHVTFNNYAPSADDPGWQTDVTDRLERIETAVQTEGVALTSLGTSVDDLASAVADIHTRFDQENQALAQALADAQAAKDALAAAQADDASDKATIDQKTQELDAANQAAVDAANRIAALTSELQSIGQSGGGETPPTGGGDTPPADGSGGTDGGADGGVDPTPPSDGTGATTPGGDTPAPDPTGTDAPPSDGTVVDTPVTDPNAPVETPPSEGNPPADTEGAGSGSSDGSSTAGDSDIPPPSA